MEYKAVYLNLYINYIYIGISIRHISYYTQL